MVLDLIDDARWARLVTTRQRVHDLEPAELTPVPKWNRAMEAWSAAFDDVVCDPELLSKARGLVGLTTNRQALHFLHEVLEPPVSLFAEGIPKLLRDPRVGLDPASVLWAKAIYVTEHTIYGRDDPYDTDNPRSGLTRSASRIGGAPTVIPGRGIPEIPFLLQVDLRQGFSGVLPQPRSRAFLRASGLPRNGILQLFHTTDTDSANDPRLPGGGATVVYLTEAELRHRRTAPLFSECVAFPVHDAKLAVLPSFGWGESPDDDTALKIIDLQDAVERFARGEEVSDEASRQQAINPFRVIQEPSTRLLGLPHYDHAPLEPWQVEELTEGLPLTTPDDEHVLLFDVAAGFSLDNVYGDGGRLEVWIRRSDLLAQRFDDVYSAIRY